MDSGRVYGIQEARPGFLPRRRQPPNPRANVLPGDPPWMHAGKTFQLTVKGTQVDLFPVSVMAAALGRCVAQVRRLEAQGVLPPPIGRKQSRRVAGQYRLYTRAQVLAAARAVLEADLYLRRSRHWTGPLVPTK